MSLRRIAALVFALATACARSVNSEATPAFVDYSVFDPSTAELPLPNDLALASAPTLAAGAQRDLLLAFAAEGGFPNDIEVPITVDFTRSPVGPGARIAPVIDPASIRPIGVADTNLALFKITPLGPVPAAYDPAAVVLTQSGSKTTLHLRAPKAADGSRNWDAGAHYALAVRGGPKGVQTVDGHEIHPMPAMFLLLAGKNLADPANQSLLPDPSAGAQLEQIRQNYLPVFNFIDAIFPSHELANLQTFQIAPLAGTVVRVDQTAGVVPLPFDLLRTDADGTVIFNSAFGPAAAGIDTLDGFSTTAMMIAPTSGPIDAATVTGNVFLFKLAGLPTLVPDVAGALFAGQPGAAVYLTQPPIINQACLIPSGSCSTVIGLQPAVPVPTGTPAGTLYLPPLDEDTEYAIVITKGVKDVAGKALERSTLAKIILDVASSVSTGGVSQLAGIDDATAAMLEHMRDQLAHVFVVLPGGKTKADVAMAYTFKTQSITGPSLRLAALPFSVERGAGAAVFSPVTTSVQPLDVNAAFGLTPPPDVDSFYTLLTPTVDAIDPATGALRSDLATLTPAQIAALVKPLPAIVAVPKYAAVPSCGLPPPNDALHCAKVVVFEHGLGGDHLQTIYFADALAANGFIVAAIDFPLHGDRSYCSTDADCNTGGTCVAIPNGAGQGDAVPPGVCSNGNKLVPPQPLQPPPLTTVASGRYFLSANFFRIRDSFRQNLIDQSALALSIARPPQIVYPFQPATNDLAAALQAKGIVADPTAVYVEGISLGSIAGTQVLATSSRFTRGALSVGGATETDVILNSPAFKQQIDLLFINSLGFDRNDPANAARYLLTVNLAKWILDPGDPLNFAKHVRTSPLPDLLSPTGALQSKKDVWGQIAQGDLVVPNPYNFLLYGNSAVPTTVYTHFGGDAPHDMLAKSATAQANAAAWLFNLTKPAAPVDLTDFP